LSFVWTTFVFQILAFLILLYFLSKKAFGPLMGIMEKRRQLVAEQMASAEKNRKDAETLIAEQQAALQAARKDAYDIIEQSKTSAARQADDIVAQAKAEAARLKEDAVRDIEREKNKAVAALRAEVGAMSVAIATKIIEKQIDEASQQTLVDEYLKEVGGVQ